MHKKKTSQKKIKLARKQGLYLKDTGHKGRGVFCTEDIRKGEILEVTPTIILDKSATAAIEGTTLGNYVFRIGAISRSLRKKLGIRDTAKCSGVIMGIISYFNHAEEPNAEVEWEEHGDTLYHQVRALCRIPKNTEICTSYGGGWFDDRKDIRRHK